MPTDLKNYIEKSRKDQEEFLKSVVEKATGDATRSVGMGVYVSGAIAAMVAGVAFAL
jgi:hypothetical protein